MHLCLVGGGHAHVEVLRQLPFWRQDARLAQLKVTLISPERFTGYSGMMPGVIAGHYQRRQAQIDLAALARRAEVTYLATALLGLAPEQTMLTTEGQSLDYDVCSFNIGSTPFRPAQLQGSHVFVKPFGQFLDQVDSLLTAPSLTVIGGGAAGVEVCLALAQRGHSLPIRLVCAEKTILPHYPTALRHQVLDALADYKIELVTGFSVTHASFGYLHSEQSTLAVDTCVWATGAAAPTLFADCGLRLSTRGAIAVGTSLQSLSHPNVYAAGDCANTTDDQWPKAGVVPVRQAALLAENIKASCLGLAPTARFINPKHSLSILALGRQTAVASKYGLTLSGAWVWRWKNHLDQGFVKRYQY
jgi:selenide, water dikinase